MQQNCLFCLYLYFLSFMEIRLFIFFYCRFLNMTRSAILIFILVIGAYAEVKYIFYIYICSKFIKMRQSTTHIINICNGIKNYPSGNKFCAKIVMMRFSPPYTQLTLGELYYRVTTN